MSDPNRFEPIGLGNPVQRVEDPQLLTGRGRYVDDLVLANLAHACVVRSPYAHALITAIETDAAMRSAGVLAVLTGSDLAAAGIGDLPCVSVPAAIVGNDWFRTPFPALARDRVRAVGQAVAVVIAQSRTAALDGAEQVQVDYEPLPATASLETALEPGAEPVWAECPDNVCFKFELGDRAATDAAFARAAHVIEHRYASPRVAGAPLEPRASIGRYDPGRHCYELITNTQTPHRIRGLLASQIFKVPVQQIRVRVGDVGGGFGTKGNLYPEDVLVLWAAARVSRPVKWIADRSESLLADFNGRDHLADAALALDAEGRILGLRVKAYTNLGCQIGPSGGFPAIIGARLLSGVYAIPAMHVTAHGMLTHTMTTTTYRGAGRPEAAFTLERLLDCAALRLRLDRVELRKKHFITPAQMPFRTAVGETYDAGDFPGLLDRALALADWDGYPVRKSESQARGLLRGRGLAMFIEVAGVHDERVDLRIDPEGRARLAIGTCAQGQGHETMYRQMLVEWLALPFDAIEIVQGDTDAVAYGIGTYAARSMTVGGSAIKAACADLIARSTPRAAELLQADPTEVQFESSRFIVRSSERAIALPEVARSTPDGLAGHGEFMAKRPNYPNGCHVVEVEIDPDTGELRIDRYTAVDDVGRVLNPLLCEGQIVGGIVQGAGPALTELLAFDADGQPLARTFSDYALPRAGDLPVIATALHNTPTATNPLGIKGAGETGTVGAAAAIVNAAVDALATLGVEHLAMPLTPARVWHAIESARRRDDGAPR